jgi:hypothetical protein
MILNYLLSKFTVRNIDDDEPEHQDEAGDSLEDDMLSN